MQDARALKNTRNLSSWRAWQGEAFGRSGFIWLMAGVSPFLTTAFVVACALYKPAPRDVATLLGLYLVMALGLVVVASLRLNAWKRAHPWTPPS
jgi:hypothetical protein